MSLDDPTDILTVKRESTLYLLDYTLGSAPADHFRFLVYQLDQDGGRTLVFTSDTFTSVTGKSFLLQAVNDVPNDEIGVDYDVFYQAELHQYNAGETIDDTIDEFFFYTFPNQQLTQSDAGGSIDETIFDRLLYQLGFNTSLLEFNNTGGYTSRIVRRGYNSILTDEAATVILNAATPDDADVVYKTEHQLTTGVDGNQLQSIEREAEITP